MKFKKLSTSDFAKLLGDEDKTVRDLCRHEIRKNVLEFRKLSQEEKDQVVLAILKRVNSFGLAVSGSGNKKRWAKGWSENLKSFKNNKYDLTELVPKFIRPNQPIRLWGDYVMPKQNNSELMFYEIFRSYLFKKYLDGVENVYEFGCGTGFNLVYLARTKPNLELHGLDWVSESKEIVDIVAKQYHLNIRGHLFDMFTPNQNFKIKKKSAVVIIGALEQLGENFKKFISYLIAQKPTIVIHVDSIDALYDVENLSDYLALLHDQRRNYLKNYLNYMRNLETNGKIKFIKIQKVSCGGLYHDGYSYDVWKVTN